MTITKTLMLAGFAVMSLGVGSAMAEGEATSDYWAQQYRVEAAANATRAPASTTVQSGASDVQSPAFHVNTNITAGGF